MIKAKSLAAALALAALMQAPVAQAQESCVSEKEVAALAIYAAPSLIQGVSTRCGKNLPANGFLATQGAALAQRYQTQQLAVWPQAKQAMLKLINKPDEVELIRQLPDDAVRPLFGSVVSQMLVKDIKPADCGKIERGIKILAPLPVESVGEITGFLMSMAGSESKGPKVCPYDDKTASRNTSG